MGVSLRRTERTRIALLASCISLIRHARRKIDLFETPTAELFLDFSDGFEEETRRALVEKPLTEALSPVVTALGTDGEPLAKFVCEIGSGYKDDAIRLCDYCLSILEDRQAAAVDRYGSQKKLYLILPLLFAVSLIVLLL